MRKSTESKPTTNGTSRDAISPDVENMFHVKHQTLTKQDKDALPDEVSVAAHMLAGCTDGVCIIFGGVRPTSSHVSVHTAVARKRKS